MYFVVKINDLVIVKDNKKYHFLNEMNSSQLLHLYHQLFYLEKISNSNIKNIKIFKKQIEIKDLLKRLNIPEYIIVKSDNNKFIEIYTNEELNLDPEVSINVLHDEEFEIYSSKLTKENVNYLKKKIPLFNKSR